MFELFVIQHNDTGKYVTAPGSERSYTSFLQHAHSFASLEEANKQVCEENETVQSVRDLFPQVQ